LNTYVYYYQYNNLYKNSIDDSNNRTNDLGYTFLNDNNIPYLSEEEEKQCDECLSELELKNSLRQMKNGKSPGSDGLTAEFYKIFWNDIKNAFTEAVHYSFEVGELTPEQQKGIISLKVGTH
jgi:hypothetical protein